MPSLGRLDAIWSCRPNNKPVTAVDTLLPASTVALPVLLLVGKATTGSAGASEGDNDDVAGDEPERLGGAKATLSLSPINLKSDDDKGGNDAHEAPTGTHRSKPRARGISTQRGRLTKGPGGLGREGLKKLLEVNEARKEARDEKRIEFQEARDQRCIKVEEARDKRRIKVEEASDERRIKVEADLQMHRVDSERATAERIAEIQARRNERMAEIHTAGNRAHADANCGRVL